MTRQPLFYLVVCVLFVGFVVAPAVPAVGQPSPDARVSVASLWDKEAVSVVLDDGVVTAPMLLTGDFAVRAIFHVGSDFTQHVKELHVLSLAGAESGPALQLVWEQQLSGWWPTWQFRLVAGSEVMLNDKAAGSVSLGQHAPRPGHTYEAVLSYNQASGAVSVAVTDVTEGQTTMQATAAASLPLPLAVQSTVHGAAGPMVFDASTVTVDTLQTLARYVPVGTQWTRLIQHADGSTLAGQRVHAGEHLLVTVGGDVPATKANVHVVLARADGHIIGEYVAEPQQPIRIAGDDLPVGWVHMSLVYTDEQGAVTLETRPIQVGHLHLLVHEVTPDHDAGVVRGGVQITAASPVDNVALQLGATVSRRVWNAHAQAYEDEVYERHVVLDTTVTVAANDPVTIPFSVPFPKTAGTWRLQPWAETPMSYTLHTGGGLLLFDTAAEEENKSGAVSLRACTYNVYGFDGYPDDAARKALGGAATVQRVDHFVEVMRELDCDIIGLQEANSVAWAQVFGNRLGYDTAVSSTRTRFPGIVLSRYPVLETRDYATGGPAGDVPYSRTAGAALLDVAGRSVWVVNLHAHPNDEALRSAEARILGERVDELLEESPHMIVLGDFNSVAGAVIHKALTDRGFINTMELAADAYHPTMNQLTGGIGVRAIDHIYVSESLIGTVRRSWVVVDPGFRMPDNPAPDDWLHSDHLPVAAELVW